MLLLFAEVAKCFKLIRQIEEGELEGEEKDKAQKEINKSYKELTRKIFASFI